MPKVIRRLRDNDKASLQGLNIFRSRLQGGERAGDLGERSGRDPFKGAQGFRRLAMSKQNEGVPYAPEVGRGRSRQIPLGTAIVL